MFIELINNRGEKVFVRPKEIRWAKVEKLESSYCGNFVIENEDFYSEETFNTSAGAENFIKETLNAKDKEDL